MEKRDLAIVLRAIRYQDRHLIVTGLTQNHGKITALAKNAVHSKRFGGTLQPFVASEWIFKAKNDLYLLQETTLKRSFSKLSSPIETYMIACFLNEWILKTTPANEKIEDLFKLHAKALDLLEATPTILQALILLNAYLSRILQGQGISPAVTRCLICQKGLHELERNQSITIDIESTKFQCNDCHPSQSPLNIGLLQDLVVYLAHPLSQSTRMVTPSLTHQWMILETLEKFLLFHVPGLDAQSFKSLDLLKQTILLSNEPLREDYPLQNPHPLI